MAKIKIIEVNDEDTGYESYLASEIYFENGDSYILESEPAFVYSDNIDTDIKHINDFVDKWQSISVKEDFDFEISVNINDIIEELKDEKS